MRRRRVHDALGVEPWSRHGPSSPWRSPRPSRPPGSCDDARRGPGARRARAPARAGRGRSASAVGRCQVAMRRQREARVGLGRSSRRRRASRTRRRRCSVRSRVSRNATWPGRVPGRGDDLERADAVAGRDRPRRARLARRGSCRAACASGSPGSGVLSLASRRASRAEIRTSTPGSAPASASSEPMWSPWAWVRAMRTIGAPRRPAASRIGVLAARQHRVDQREPVVLGDEVGVDHAEAGDPGGRHRAPVLGLLCIGICLMRIA